MKGRNSEQKTVTTHSTSAHDEKVSQDSETVVELLAEVTYLSTEMRALQGAIAQLQVHHYEIAELLLIALGGLSPEEAHSLVSEVFEAKRDQ